MRFPRVRFTIRGMMVVVFAAAVLFRLLLVAERSFFEPGDQTLCHLREYRDTGELFVYGHAMTAGNVWSKYWRQVLGLP